MAPILGFVFLVVPLIELAIIIEVGQRIGVFATIATLIAMSVLGAVLAKREGVAVWRRARQAVAAGQIPSNELVDGFLVLFGAALLLTPGFLTDALGLALLLPVSRAVLKRWFRKGAGWALLGRLGVLGKAGRRAGTTVKVVRVATSKPSSNPSGEAPTHQGRVIEPKVEPEP